MPNIFKSFLKPSFSKYVFPEAEDLQVELKEVPEELAPTEELFANTLHPYTEALLSAIPVVDEEDKRERILLEGDIPSPVNPPSGCKFHTRCRYCQQKCKEEVPEWTDVGNNHYVACHFPLHKKEG